MSVVFYGVLPVRFDICDGSDVVFGCEYKFIVQHPLRSVIQAGGWM